MADTIDKQLEDESAKQKCYKCGEPCDRLITFATLIGIVQDYECIDCRQARVKEQIELGLRPASDLDLENLPEKRKAREESQDRPGLIDD